MLGVKEETDVKSGKCIMPVLEMVLGTPQEEISRFPKEMQGQKKIPRP